jgi:hypothetical protein
MSSPQGGIDPQADVRSSVQMYGTRTSSMMTLYSGFESYFSHRDQSHLVRFKRHFESRVALVGTEPFCPPEDKAGLFSSFQQSQENIPVLAMPVELEFASRMVARGFDGLYVGSEPVFELGSYFSDPAGDPISRLPLARSLKQRGARVERFRISELSETQTQAIQRLTSDWVKKKSTALLGFLNQVDPFHLAEEKRFFLLTLHGRVEGFLTSLPFKGGSGQYFSEYIRSNSSRAGTIELLMIEAMRSLWQERVLEVRMGLCPLARLEENLGHFESHRLAYQFMRFLYRSRNSFYSFKSIYEFKAKLQPTRWEPLFLTGKKLRNPILWIRVLETLYDQKATRMALDGFSKRLSSWIRPGVALRPNATLTGTLAITGLLTALHVAKSTNSWVMGIYAHYPFAPLNSGALGIFLSSLFHNNHFHAFGDLLTLFVFGAVIEIYLGKLAFLSIMALGLWASNPLAVLILELTLSRDSSAWASLLAERDYGTSNAAYALAGAFAALARRPYLILVPFAMNALFLCVARNSLLSIHHLTGLGIGLASAMAFRWLAGNARIR